jgi:hypothetical protein
VVRVRTILAHSSNVAGGCGDADETEGTESNSGGHKINVKHST